MTYGENAGTIRDQLAVLLSQHRIQQRLGGPGTYRLPESTTLAEREQMGLQIQCYRYATLRWSRQALEAVSPKTDVHRSTTLQLSPLEELCRQVDRSMTAYPAGAPLGELLDIQPNFELVTRWQRIARAAVLGEHDFTTDVNLGYLNPAQAHVVANDAANVILGLVVLDRRYERIPGWRHLRELDPLSRAATDVAHRSMPVAGDLTVDVRGWRPALGPIAGAAPAGVAGAVQAQHNLLIELAHLPHALNLRRLLYTQTEVSHEAATHAASDAPELLERFRERRDVYRKLLAQSRNLGGAIGDGGQAVTQSQLAVSRLQASAPGEPGSAGSLHHLQRLFMHTDARMASTIEHGLRDRLYLVSTKVPQLGDQQINGVHQTRVQWIPATHASDTDLVPIVREQLRPRPIPTLEPRRARSSREVYLAALPPRAITQAPPF